MPERDFSAAVREHQPKLYRTACFLAGDRRDGGELFQDALAEAWQDWDDSIAREAVLTWLCGILVRRYEQRQRARKPAAAKSPAGAQRDSPTALLWEALDALLPKQRGVLVLRYAEDMSVEQIAETLRESPATVKSRLGEAHAQVGENLRGAGIGKPRS
ncbi:MAG: sigma-70 family RNA polymerase sigma factor [Verrucomicrobia bacterium]|nr:sigma-70 family RNA polymerase sigma factor [Verrucomicrobiota bacterium]